jgi:hypothetical protein
MISRVANGSLDSIDFTRLSEALEVGYGPCSQTGFRSRRPKRLCAVGERLLAVMVAGLASGVVS